MKIITTELGEGDKVAVLVHGVFTDNRTWRRVGPALAERGYRVVSVDLGGHGQSPRSAQYSIEGLGQDVLDSVPARPDLLIGHSLGALVASKIVDRLDPQRVIYEDPPFLDGKMPLRIRMFFGALNSPVYPITAKRIAKLAPQWDQPDANNAVDAYGLYDRRVLKAVIAHPAWLETPTKMGRPSLVLVAQNDSVMGPVRGRLEALGFDFRVIPDTGHSVHLDNFDGFMAATDDWLATSNFTRG
jgi:pimeloyl-ACP methyl ester carboxylesterase